ncbi:MAG: RNA polymerase sigma-70 factor [Mangrovibacterium sp.]|nr:RNA polymerase sigma-70 factor [Mangrovibacterium sp.]
MHFSKYLVILEHKGKHKFIRFREERSQESFTDFFNFYYHRLTQFATTILRSELLSEEIVLDVFLKLWEQRKMTDTIDNIETYLYISVRNKAINALKDKQKFHFDMLENAHVRLAGYKAPAESELIEHELFGALHDAVNRLPAKCKIIFKLIREDGLTRIEVAHILNISVKTVDNQVAIAVRKIADQLHIDLSNPKNSHGLMTFLLTL